MASVSLCMIVRDEEASLGRCLDSVCRLVDEIVLADTGSSDRTKEIGLQYTKAVYDCPWEDDFSAARNYAFSKASCQYWMWMDADDVLPEAYQKAFLEMKGRLREDTDIVMMPYHTAFDGEGRPTFTYFRERIVRGNGAHWFQGRVHEAIPLEGRVQYVDIPLEHRRVKEADSGRNLRIYRRMQEEGEAFGPRELYYFGRELYYHGQYQEAAEVLEEHLGRRDAWVENQIDATRILAYCRYALGEEEQALGALLWGLSLDVPRAETCCGLGRHFLDRGRLSQAQYWFRQALQAGKNPRSGAFIQEECYGLYPAMALADCCQRMGELREAERYRQLAAQIREGGTLPAGSSLPDSG